MIIVCSLRAAPEEVAVHRPARVVSILGPDMPHPAFASIAPDNHLRLTFHDVAMASEGLTAPRDQDMQRLLTFISGWDRKRPLLIHCWAGISRSTAAAYIALCQLQPRVDERALAQALRAASPSATPNPMLVGLADDALGRGGRMRRGIAAIGRGADAFEGTPFVLPLDGRPVAAALH